MRHHGWMKFLKIYNFELQ